MTAYILTPEQHAQIVDALEYSTPIAEFDDMQSEATAQIEHNTALEMFKAMQPVTPAFYMSKHQSKPRFYREGETLPTNVVSLYAKEQQ